MKRFKLVILALMIAAFGFAVPAHAVLQDMSAAVYKWEGKMGSDGKAVLTQITSGITFKVLAVGTTTAETTYYPGKTTSLTNPVTTTSFASTSICNKKVAFRVDPTDATSDRYVDLIVVDTNGGYTAFVEDFDRYTHTIVIDERPNIVHQGTIWYGASSTSEQNTGVKFLPNTLVLDVRVEPVTVTASGTLDVGIYTGSTVYGDADGFRAGVLLSTAGMVADTGVVTAGTTIDWTAATTYGALLYTAITGSDAVAAGGGRSYLGYVVKGTGAYDGTISYTLPSTTGAGLIHYWFNRFR